MAKYTKKQRKHLKSKSGKKNKTGKRLKQSGKKLIGGAKYKVGDVIRNKQLSTITNVSTNGLSCKYTIPDYEFDIDCDIIDNEDNYEKVGHDSKYDTRNQKSYEPTKYIVGDLIRNKQLSKITNVLFNDGVPYKYIFNNDQDYYLPCELVDNEEEYEKIQIDKSHY
jgi:hypothetical protein